jgi:hypothetical protein
MNKNLLVLERSDVYLYRVRDSKTSRLVMMLSYQDSTFRLISQFNPGQKERAKNLAESLIESRKQRCIVLEQGPMYSVWLEVPGVQSVVEQGASQKDLSQQQPSTPTTVNLSQTQICLLIIQTIADDIEDLMGTSQKRAFQEELTKIFKQSLLPGAETSQNINPLLTINPLTATQLPTWGQKEIDILFPRLGRLGKKYFSSTTFVERTVELLQNLPFYSNPKFMYCCMQFVLLCKR